MDFELQHAYDATIESWVRMLGLRDRQLEGHAVRVSELSTALAPSLGVKSDELLKLRSGSLLHDIGKIALPDSILKKSSPLNEKEQSVVEQHPQYGKEILAPIPFFQSLLDIVYCHHENWDGSGYPQGLKDEDIPQLARILAVCNYWDNLVAPRPYYEPLSRGKALSKIEQKAGGQFDPEIVEAFMQLFSHEN
jgi:putative nucleotidyltransferase with HDIG domain